MGLCMGTCDEIEVATIATNETTILEIKGALLRIFLNSCNIYICVAAGNLEIMLPISILVR